jgi:hypothetical protein
VWSAYGPCNATCGAGTKLRTYSITKPAKNGGQPCEAADGAVQEATCTVTSPAFDSTDCTKCNAGYGGPGCIICPVGEWSAGGDANTTTCAPCFDNSNTTGTGTNSSDGCGE